MLPPVSASALVASAKSFIGTPWHHAGRLPGVGLDCLGLVVCAFEDNGLAINDSSAYGYLSDEWARLSQRMADYLEVVEGDPQPGDVIVFRTSTFFHHLAMAVGDGRMVHAWDSEAVHSRVIEQTITPAWARRIHSVQRYKAVIA